MAQLEYFPQGTVGSDLYLLLKKHGYHLLDHYEMHDAKHLLLGYDFTEQDEVKMQYYFVAQGVWTFPALGSVLLGTLLLPEYLHQYIREYRRGRAARLYPDWDDPALFHAQTEIMQHSLNTKKLITTV